MEEEQGTFTVLKTERISREGEEIVVRLKKNNDEGTYIVYPSRTSAIGPGTTMNESMDRQMYASLPDGK